MNFSDKKYVNKFAILGHAIISTVIVLAYITEVLQGQRTWGYIALISVLSILPVIIEIITFAKNPESKIIKHLMGVTYGIFYGVVVFTTKSTMAYTYAFPMFFVVTIYADFVLANTIAAGATIINIANVVYTGVSTGFAGGLTADLKIRIACSIIIALYMIAATFVNRKVNGEKLKQINEQKDGADKLLEKVLAASDSMSNGIVEAASQVKTLGMSMENISNSMSEVSAGSGETAESVQEQLVQTQTIQAHIATVKDSSYTIVDDMSETMKMVAEGSEQMDALTRNVAESIDANTNVIEQMKLLSEYTEQMNTITDTITSITNSTSLLALNASIEAARAGESGKGFAVVAGQITKLAEQTREATASINKLIQNISDGFVNVEEAISAVAESNECNAKSAHAVKDSFEGIAEKSAHINDKSIELGRAVEALEEANNGIVDKIQTISAISEEVSAHADSTNTACEENNQLVIAMSELINKLNEEAMALKQ